MFAIRFISSRYVTMIYVSGSMLEILYVMSAQKQVTDVSLVLKDNGMESENPSLLIPLFVSDGKKTNSSNMYHLKVYNNTF